AYARGVTSDRPLRPPLALLVALLLVLVEVGALLALSGGMLLEVLRGQTEGGIVTAVLAAMFLGLCAILVVAARALHQRRRWGRGPVITWQLLLLAIGVSQDRKSTRLNSSHVKNSYAVFCLKTKITE